MTQKSKTFRYDTSSEALEIEKSDFTETFRYNSWPIFEIFAFGKHFLKFRPNSTNFLLRSVHFIQKLRFSSGISGGYLRKTSLAFNNTR